MTTRSTNCPNFDINDAMSLFLAYLDECVDDGARSAPIDNHLAAVYQVFALVKLDKAGGVVFNEGEGHKTPNARAYRQLVKAGFANVEEGYNLPLKRWRFTLTKEGMALVKWMLEGKRKDE